MSFCLILSGIYASGFSQSIKIYNMLVKRKSVLFLLSQTLAQITKKIEVFFFFLTFSERVAEPIRQSSPHED